MERMPWERRERSGEKRPPQKKSLYPEKELEALGLDGLDSSEELSPTDEEDLEDMDWNDDWDSLKDVDCDDLENMDWDDWDDFKDININCKDNGKGMDDNTRVKIIPVNDKRIAAGKTIYLGEYNLSNGDKIRYDLLAEKGEGMQVFFAKDEHKDKVYWSVHNLRQPGEVLECTADFTIDCLEKSGTYKLFLSAVDGALEKVVGNIFIITR